MILLINDEPLEIPDGTTLPDLLSTLEISDTAGMAMAINDTVIPREGWQSLELCDHDRVLIITATQGG